MTYFKLADAVESIVVNRLVKKEERLTKDEIKQMALSKDKAVRAFRKERPEEFSASFDQIFKAHKQRPFRIAVDNNVHEVTTLVSLTTPTNKQPVWAFAGAKNMTSEDFLNHAAILHTKAEQTKLKANVHERIAAAQKRPHLRLVK